MSKWPWGNAINLLDVQTGARTAVDFGTPLWEASMEWARFHGLNPMRIPAGSLIERDAARCEIRYDAMVEGPDGKPMIFNNDLVRVRRTERGEAPPLPFPAPDDSAMGKAGGTGDE